MDKQTTKNEGQEMSVIENILGQLSKLSPQEQEKVGFFIQGYLTAVSVEREGDEYGIHRGRTGSINPENSKRNGKGVKGGTEKF